MVESNIRSSHLIEEQVKANVQECDEMDGRIEKRPDRIKGAQASETDSSFISSTRRVAAGEDEWLVSDEIERKSAKAVLKSWPPSKWMRSKGNFESREEK